MITRVIVVLLLCFALPSFSESSERRQIKKSSLDLAKAKTILLEATNRSVFGQCTNTHQIHKIFSKRMEKIGYTVTTHDTQEHDVIVQLDCEEQSSMIDQTINPTSQYKPNTFFHPHPVFFTIYTKNERCHGNESTV